MWGKRYFNKNLEITIYRNTAKYWIKKNLIINDAISSFLLRDADMHSAYLLRQRGWLAGWLAVTRRYCIKTAKPKLFRPPGSHIILVSSYPCADTQFQSMGTHSAGALNTRGKIGDFRAIFDGNRRVSRKRCEKGRWLLWNVNRKSWVPD